MREGRSFSPDEFAIALEQVVAGTAPEDYRDPNQFFSRTCFTRAFRDHVGMVLRRLDGKTENTAPVLTLITQFGGGKTHTLTALYHLAKHGPSAARFPGVSDLVRDEGVSQVPPAKVAVFVGNAWDPREGRETPWIDIARQIADDAGVAALGPAAKTTPPGTEAITRLFQVAGGTVLILFDEVLNFLNRHRPMAESFYAFFDNINRATTGTVRCAAVMSLPRSQMEMTDYDLQWQDRITKVVRRVAKDLIVNDEAEISEVVRRRLFEDLGNEKIRKNVARAYADWCFERRAQLPPEWTAVDTTTTEAKAREFLRSRFETCYPFHPATLSVFQRKWQTLPQYQQTRGTLAMLAQWISWAYREGFKYARREPLITLGSAPLDVPEFRSTILGQLGEAKLIAAIDADIAGTHGHARALDADTKGPLKEIHRRAATTILFESSGGQVQKVAHLPELRFALGEPDVDTTSIDNAAFSLESKAYYIRRHGSDGFVVHHKPTLKKVVSDRRASLDEEEVRTTALSVVRKEFERGAAIPISYFPPDSTAIPDSPRLTLIVVDPKVEWGTNAGVRDRIAEWTRRRGESPRLYPAALVWCVKKPARDLMEKVEMWLAWRRVEQEIVEGTLGVDFDRSEQGGLRTRVKDAEDTARDEVWAGYRFVVLADNAEADGLKVIDLGAGHASAAETLCGRVLAALKSQGLLNETVSASYIDRKWPPALKESGAWPLSGLRQSFLNGALTRLVDPDTILRGKIVEFVQRGDFGLATGHQPYGKYSRVWSKEPISADEVTFEADMFLLTKATAELLKAGIEVTPPIGPGLEPAPATLPGLQPAVEPGPGPTPGAQTRILRLVGTVSPEVWNRIGIKLLPKLRSGSDLKIGVDFSVTIDAAVARNMEAELRQALADLGLSDRLHLEEG